MIVSAIRPRIAGLAALAAACFLADAAALAQSNAPKVLRPGARAAQPAEPVKPGAIQVGRLDAPGRVAAGVLRPEDGGLPVDLWQGSDRQILWVLFNRMPGHYQSSAARTIARRTLLSAGEVPDGQPGDNVVLAQRMQLVLGMGDPQSAVALARAAGGGAADPEIAEQLAEALFALGETDDACDTVQGQITLGGRGYWQRASVFCDIRAERIDAAELTLSLMSETGQRDARFNKLADALLGGSSIDITAEPDMTALDAAMIAGSKSAVLRKPEQLPPHLAQLISTAGSVKTTGRIQAGVHAVRSAGMSPAVVMLLFGGSAGQPGAPFRDPVVTAMSADSSAVRAEALNDLWNKAVTTQDQITAAAFAKGLLTKLQPEAGLAFAAPAAFRMNLLNGDHRGAEAWLVVLRRNATAGNLPPEELGRANALARLAGLGRIDDRLISVWLESQLDGERSALAMRVLLALDALGDPVNDTLWQRVLTASRLSEASGGNDISLWRQLVMAAGGVRTGETALAALSLIGEGPVARLDPIVLSTVIGSLRRVGMEAEARSLAVEALIGQGG